MLGFPVALAAWFATQVAPVQRHAPSRETAERHSPPSQKYLPSSENLVAVPMPQGI